MSKYFNFFPKTLYTTDAKNADVVNNITSRFNFEETFKNNTAVCYEYDIQDSDTPEIIASKFYGDSEKHWIVLSFNDIVVFVCECVSLSLKIFIVLKTLSAVFCVSFAFILMYN